jgi:Glycosyl transferases group 1
MLSLLPQNDFRRTQMESDRAKPRLVFFQFKYDRNLPEFLLIHKQEHVKCLSEFFDVVVINEDCDYRQICDTYRPDLALFESGVNHVTCQRLDIRNVRSANDIPKIGLHHADGFCNARAGFLSDMEHWGIETFFAISTTAGEHNPELADNLFVWPVFVDGSIYRDYGIWKSIPVLFTGNRNQFYPWRTKIIKLVSEQYPSLLCPHPGYGPKSSPARVMIGETYARTINASWFVPSCGTVARETVRKHFEIPASKACLIAERTPALEAAGFGDMRNCVFADETDVLDKLNHLFRNEDQLNAIIDAGHRMVHSRHTLKQRDQIYQWFILQKTLQPDQRIIQPNPFEPLQIVEKSSGVRTGHVISQGMHRTLLQQGDEKLWNGAYEGAEDFYRRCATYMLWMPEPKLRLALCSLYRGNPKLALARIEEPIGFVLCMYKARDPDPVEWAYFIICWLCLGKPAEALKRANEYPWLRHPELDRARWAARVLAEGAVDPLQPLSDADNRRRSMHQMPERSFPKWVGEVAIMLRACGQSQMAAVLTASAGVLGADGSEAMDEKSFALPPDSKDGAQSSGASIAFFKKRIESRKRRSDFSKKLGTTLRRLEGKYGYFLPYHLSESRVDEYYKAVRDLAREDRFRTALLIGAESGRADTEAFLTGAGENAIKPKVFCIGDSHRRRSFLRRSRTVSNASWNVPSLDRGDLAERVGPIIERIKTDNQIETFDVLSIDSSIFFRGDQAGGLFLNLAHQATFVLLSGLNNFHIGEIHNQMMKEARFSLIAHNPGLRAGFAIYKKRADDETVEAEMNVTCAAE